MQNRKPTTLSLSTARLLIAACTAMPPSVALAQTETLPSPNPPAAASAVADESALPQGENVDYGQVLTIFRDAIGPVRTEMGTAVKAFQRHMQRSNELMNAGDFDAAIDYTLESINAMLELRDRVVEPLLSGQEAMVVEMAPLRKQLAEALADLDEQPEPETGLGALSNETRDHLKRLAKQYQNAPNDSARQLAEQKFRTTLRIAQLSQRNKHSDRVTQAKRRLIERLDQMLAVLGEVSVNAELTFATLDSQSQLFEQYRSSLKLARTAQDVEQQLSEMFGPMGFGGSLDGLEGVLEDFSLHIDDQLDTILDDLGDSASDGVMGGSDADTLDMINQLLQESE